MCTEFRVYFTIHLLNLNTHKQTNHLCVGGVFGVLSVEYLHTLSLFHEEFNSNTFLSVKQTKCNSLHTPLNGTTDSRGRGRKRRAGAGYVELVMTVDLICLLPCFFPIHLFPIHLSPTLGGRPTPSTCNVPITFPSITFLSQTITNRRGLGVGETKP